MSKDITSNSATKPPADNAKGEAPPRKKRRRWLRRLGVVILLIAILVGCLPYLISTGPGTRLLVTLANHALPGTLSVRDLSLSWLGPCTISGAGLRDLQDREVIRIDGVAYAAGIWRTVISPGKFGELRIDNPLVSVYSDQNGRISLVDALVSPEPSPAREEKPTSLPELSGRVVLQTGSIQIVRADGQQLDVSQIKIACDLDTLDNIEGTLGLQVGKSGTLAGEMKIHKLAPGGQLKPLEASGTIRLSTPNDVAIAELASFAMGQAHAGGKANLKLDVVLDNGKVQADLNTGVAGLQMRHAEGGRGKPIDARLTAAVHATKESLTARASMEGQAGTGQVDATYPLTDQSRLLSFNELLSAVLSGKTDSLPKATVDGRCQVDLVKLVEAVPALLDVRPDVEVTSGTLTVEGLAVRGGPQPSVTGTIAIRNLAARSGDKAIQWEPVSSSLSALVEQGRGVKVQQAEFNSGFGRIVATGSASELHADIKTDLTALHSQLNQIFHMGTMEVAGKVSGSVDLKRAGDTGIDLATALTADGLRYQQRDQRLEFANVTLKAKAVKPAQSAPILSEGDVVVRDARVGGAAVSTEDIKARWAEASISPDTSQFKVKTAQLSSSVAHLSAKAVDCRLVTPLTASGSFEGDADLAKLLATVSRASGRDKPPAITGRLTLNGNCDSTAERVRLVSNVTIDGLEVGTGDRVVRDKQVRLGVDSTLTHREDTLEITQMQLDSQFLALKLGGKISEFAGPRRLALSGQYKGSWDAITALVHELAPATADSLTISGTTGGQFEVTGYAYRPTISPVFQDVTSGTDVTWASVKAYGLDLTKGTLSPTLKQGTLQIPVAVIPASGGGQLRVGGLVDFRPAQPTLYVRDKVQLMDGIRVTPELGKYLLSRINPVFGNLTKAEGSASLMVQGVELPLSEEIKRRGAGQGRLDLRNLKIGPGGLLAEAIALGGLGKQDVYPITINGVDFTLKDGRLSYQNLVMTFGKDFDLRFRGSVGFDETLDLIMSVPVRPALLERLGVRGPVSEYARLLSDARVEVPIVGTRLQPKLDFARVDVKPLVQRAMRDAATGKTGDLLKSLGGSNLLDSGKQEPAKAPAGDAGKRSPKATEKQQATDLLERLQKSVTSRPAGDQTRKAR